MNTPARPAHAELQTVMTAAEMRRHWLRGKVRPISPILDMTVEYAGHWWNLDGNDAWVRATDPNAIAVYEAQKRRSAAAIEDLQAKRRKLHLRKQLERVSVGEFLVAGQGGGHVQTSALPVVADHVRDLETTSSLWQALAT